MTFGGCGPSNPVATGNDDETGDSTGSGGASSGGIPGDPLGPLAKALEDGFDHEAALRDGD